MNQQDQVTKKSTAGMHWLAAFTFFVAPIFSWISIAGSEESVVYASLSRMIWFLGDAWPIFIAMVTIFVPMIISFFCATKLSNLSKAKRILCRICLVVSCIVLYVGAMVLMPGDGGWFMTRENIFHGILSFGGIFLIFLTYCLYAFFIRRIDPQGAMLLIGILVFVLITGLFAVANVFDEKSYVLASGVAELYIIAMMSVVGFLTYYLSYRKS